MKLTKGTIRSIVTLGLMFLAFTILVFVIPFEGAELFDRSFNFWLSYIFAVIPFGVVAFAMQAGWASNENIKSRFYGFPIVRISLFYIAIQVPLSVIFMILGDIVPIEVLWVLYVILLCAAAIGLVQMHAVKDTIEEMDVQLKADVSAMRALQSEARVMVGQCSDPELVPILRAFSEELQYSDPMSSDALKASERDLQELVAELHRSVLDGDSAAATALCRKATLVLSERNRLCKLNK